LLCFCTAGVVGISEIIIRPGLINVDFADVRTIMGDAGTALMGIGRYGYAALHFCFGHRLCFLLRMTAQKSCTPKVNDVRRLQKYHFIRSCNAENGQHLLLTLLPTSAAGARGAGARRKRRQRRSRPRC
jgi:hypothetical protein